MSLEFKKIEVNSIQEMLPFYKIYQINFTINPTGTQTKVSKICSYFVLTNIRSLIIMNIYSKEQMFT